MSTRALSGQFRAPLQLHRGLDRLDALASRSNGLTERSPEPLIGFDQLRRRGAANHRGGPAISTGGVPSQNTTLMAFSGEGFRPSNLISQENFVFHGFNQPRRDHREAPKWLQPGQAGPSKRSRYGARQAFLQPWADRRPARRAGGSTGGY